MTTDGVGGVWTYALELAEALAPLGVDVVLATIGPPMTREQRGQVVASAVVDVHEGRFPLEWAEAPWAEVDAAGDWLLGLGADVAPDIVHLNGFVHAALPWRVPTVVVAHSCVTSWWLGVHGEAPPPAWDEYGRRVGAGLRAASAVVAPTRAMLDDVHRCYEVGGGTVVPNCRRAGERHPGTKEPLVLSAGRLWDEAKNLAALDRVAAGLGAPVAIAGEQRHPSGGEDHRGGGALLLGALAPAALATWFDRSAIFALPARYEPFGLAALEAGLAGCALVLGDIPSLREVWGGAATFVDPGDDAAIAAAIAHLLADEGAWAAAGGAARRRALTFAPARTAAGYLEVYGRLAPSVGRGAPGVALR